MVNSILIEREIEKMYMQENIDDKPEFLVILESVQIKTPVQIKREISDILSKRIGDEYYAHYFYRCAANWCRTKAYKKACQYFEKEAHNELEHSEKLQKYLADWDCVAQIPQVATNHIFADLADIINKAYKMEYGLLTSYLEDSKVIMDLDLSTFDFLQFYRTTQNDSVIEYSDLLNALKLINPGNAFELYYFEQTNF